jgi:hypothetical protein
MTRRSMMALCASLLVAGFARPQELYLVKVYDNYLHLAEDAARNGFSTSNITYPHESEGKWYTEWHGKDKRNRPWVYRLVSKSHQQAKDDIFNAAMCASFLKSKQGGL